MLYQGATRRRAGVGRVQRRQMNDAQHGAPAFDQRAIDRELAIAAEELLGAVEGIHEPEAALRIVRAVYVGDETGCRRFTGPYRHARRTSLQRAQTQPPGRTAAGRP